MVRRISWVLAAALVASHTQVQAQVGEGRIAVEPYVAYGFFGDLPDEGGELEGDVALGARAGFQLSDRVALFAGYQRATPALVGADDAVVSHWSVGTELSLVPRGGAEGMLPILLEAGVGQARYSSDFGFGPSADWALNLGIGSALQLQRNLAIRFGANDYLSTDGDGGTANHLFVRVGAELRFSPPR